MSDNELIFMLNKNPEKALEKVMDTYMSFAYAIVYGKLSNFSKHDIEECVSDIFYEFYETRDNIDLNKGSIKAYIGILSKRKAINTYKKLMLLKKNISVSIDDYEHDWLVANENVENSIIKSEQSKLLLNEIDALGEPDCLILIRKYFWGYTAKAIAEELGLKENTVNKRVSRALIKLKNSIGGAF